MFCEHLKKGQAQIMPRAQNCTSLVIIRIKMVLVQKMLCSMKFSFLIKSSTQVYYSTHKKNMLNLEVFKM